MIERWLSSDEAAAHVGYRDALSPDPATRRRGLKAFQAWVTRYGVASGHRGRRTVFLASDLDAAIAGRRRASLQKVG